MQGKAVAAVIVSGCVLWLGGCDVNSTSQTLAPVAQAQAEAAQASEAKAGTPQAEAAAVKLKVKVFNKAGKLVGPVETAKVVKSDAEWQKQLTKAQYEISRAKGTEPPFCGNLLDNKKQGVYACVCCGLPLFSSDSKFHSGTGWPSFFKPVADENVVEHEDRAHGMVRTEILCARCDGHLGHVFDDGPRPTGLRFCVNSESLRFVESDKLATLADPIAEHPDADAK